MGPAFFVLAILGCGEGDGPCQQVAITKTRYESAAACTAATAAAAERYQGIDYPVVVAECRPAGVTVAQLKERDVKLPAPEQIPDVQKAAYAPAD
jgi:hypothetical protein